jgi:hypothetical protein
MTKKDYGLIAQAFKEVLENLPIDQNWIIKRHVIPIIESYLMIDDPNFNYQEFENTILNSDNVIQSENVTELYEMGLL